jgi:hypothetical protein
MGFAGVLAYWHSPAVHCDLYCREHARLPRLGDGLQELRQIQRWMGFRRSRRDCAFDRGFVRLRRSNLGEDQPGNPHGRFGRRVRWACPIATFWCKC